MNPEPSDQESTTLLQTLLLRGNDYEGIGRFLSTMFTPTYQVNAMSINIDNYHLVTTFLSLESRI